MGSRFRSNALAQEKTGEFWVNGKMLGTHVRGDFEEAEVALFVGKNPWQSHGIARARTTLKEIARDPARSMIVLDPRRTETADLADFHLQVRPGTDAWCLAALGAVLVEEGLVDHPWLATHATERRRGHRAPRQGRHPGLLRDRRRRRGPACGGPPAGWRARAAWPCSRTSACRCRSTPRCRATSRSCCGCSPATSPSPARSTCRPASSTSPAAASGAAGRRAPAPSPARASSPASCPPTSSPRRSSPTTPTATAPCSSRAATRRTRSPTASGCGRRSSSLEHLVVIDVAMTETARLAHYVLPVPSQYEKWEATFFNFDFPRNVFHLRRPLLEPLPGTLGEPEIHARLCEALGAFGEDDIAPLRAAAEEGRSRVRRRVLRGAGRQARARPLRAEPALPHARPDAARRGRGRGRPLGRGAPLRAGEPRVGRGGRLHRRGAGGRRAAVRRHPRQPVGPRVLGRRARGRAWPGWRTDDGLVHLAIPELLDELDALATEPAPGGSTDFPFVLSAGERRSFTANTIFRDPSWRKRDAAGSLRISPADAEGLGVADGDLVRVTTKRGSVTAAVEVNDMMQPGHVSLPERPGARLPGRGRRVPSSPARRPTSSPRARTATGSPARRGTSTCPRGSSRSTRR